MLHLFRSRIRMLLFLLAGLSIIFASMPDTIEHAQSGCPPVSNNGWPKCVTVYYTITSSLNSQSSQITSALASWNTANLTNNSKVKFVHGPAPSGGFHYTLTIRSGATQAGAPASTAKNTQTGTISSATITFNL
jgi:hypothetical protein